MSGSITIDAPSGLVVTLRQFDVSDENLLANKRAVRRGTGITDLLNAITLRVDNPKHYALNAPDKDHEEPWLDWSRVLQGDRIVVLKENRVETWGPEMTDKRPCTNCREPVETVFSLDDIPTVPLPDTSIPHLVDPDNAPIRTTLPRTGVEVKFRLLRGADDKALKKIQKRSKDKLSTALFQLRVVGIEGVKRPDWPRWLTELNGYDSSYLREAFDHADCGLEQSWGFECDECGHMWEADVKLSEDFLFPKYRGKITTTAS